MCPSAPRVCSEPGGQKPVLSLSLDLIPCHAPGVMPLPHCGRAEFSEGEFFVGRLLLGRVVYKAEFSGYRSSGPRSDLRYMFRQTKEWRPGGGTRVHHGRVGSAGLCDLKILHPWRRLKKGVKILQWPPNAREGGQYSTSVWKVCKKRGSKIYNLKKYRGQNSTSLKMGVKILHAEK